jgi:hypothetical protein
MYTRSVAQLVKLKHCQKELDPISEKELGEYFLVHVIPLSLLIRRLFRNALMNMGLQLNLPPNTWRKRWVCHIKPVGDGQSALQGVI